MAPKAPCPKCGKSCYGAQCWGCSVKARQGLEAVLEEEASLVPSLPAEPKLFGDWIVCSDLHIPYHHPPSLASMVEVADLLRVKNLCIAGDIIHADIISRYDKAGKQTAISTELISCGRILHTLGKFFDKIWIITGNHDRRLEKMVASWRSTPGGSQALDVIAKILDVEGNADDIAYGIFEHFFSNEKVKIYPLSSLTINDTWKVIHPGSCSRVPPQTERRLVSKFRMSVIGGHNHLVGFGFDDSGQDIAANIGHLSDDTKFRYMQEKVTTFPNTQKMHAFCAVLCDDTAPQGRLLPIVLHDKWFDLKMLKERLDSDGQRQV